MSSHSYELQLDDDRCIRGEVEVPHENFWPAPVVLFCHGFKGFKDWGHWPRFTRSLSESGFVVHRFNFSLAGVGAALDRHDEPEKFGRNTYGAEMEDIQFLLESRHLWGVEEAALGTGTGIIGHSRGGMVALMAAPELAIGAVVTLGSPGNSDRYDEATVAQWRKEGQLDITNVRTGQVLPLYLQVLEDFERNRDRYDVAAAVGRRAVPTLIIHGEDDEAVAVDEARLIHEAIEHEHRKLIIIPKSGHTFGSSHPLAENPSQLPSDLAQVLGHCRDWMTRFLR